MAKIEVIYEQEKQTQIKHLAALVASKVYFHLGEYEDSLEFALGAGDLFSVQRSAEKTGFEEYIDTVVSKAIEKYIKLRNDGAEIDQRLLDLVEKVFKHSLAVSGADELSALKNAVGIALESRRLDLVEFVILKGNKTELVKYTLDVVLDLLTDNLPFRNMVLKLLLKLFLKEKEPDYMAVAQCYVWLNDFKSAAELLKSLVNETGNDHELIAYQIAFDMYEIASQEFTKGLIKELPTASSVATSAGESSDAMDISSDNEKPVLVEHPYEIGLNKIKKILSGDLTIQLMLEFLYKNNKTDLLVLKNMKQSLDAKSSVYHSALTFANAFMNAGTTSDQFLRDNMEWLSKASNWTRFSATAQLGVIHKGNLKNSFNLLSPYLPQESGSVNASPYTEGGALFGLGMIYANHGDEKVTEYLSKKLKSSQNEVILHGCALGLGVACMGTSNLELFNQLKTVLFNDSAVAGEAAGLAMGLVMLGSGQKEAIDEMLQYAHETQHEKIVRGLAIGLGLIMYGKEDQCEELVNVMLADKNFMIRYAGVLVIAMAYVGTSSNVAIKKLLHLSVSDVNDDVRRQAVISLGFVLVRNPKQIPRVVQLLSESYNPHVRYGACLALGIGCAGTGNKEAMDLLEPLTKDNTDFVRQGAFIAAAMILVEQQVDNKQQEEEKGKGSAPISSRDYREKKEAEKDKKLASNVNKPTYYRKLFSEVYGQKHEDPLAKFGSVLATGIIEAGGRNVTVSMLTSQGNVLMENCVGMMLFTHFWWWYPLAHFLCLAFQPTCVVGLNRELKMPKMEFKSNAKPSLFAYPAPLKPASTEKVEKIATAVLSTTVKAKARAKKKQQKEEGAAPMEIGSPTEEKPAAIEELPKEEPLFEMLPNLSRVVPQQSYVTSVPETSRYRLVKKGRVTGILLLKDTKPGEAEEIIEMSTPEVKAAGSDAAGEEKEPSPPEPFEYVE